MIKAALDIGSNSILLLIAKVRGKLIETVFEKIYSPRLGHAVARTGRLSETSMLKAEEDLIDALTICRHYRVEEIVGAATSAVREASNGEEFVNRIKTSLGMDIRIVTGDEEAELTYMGAVPSDVSNERIVVLDVGGGSSEITVGKGFIPAQTRSIPVGAVNLTEDFGKSPAIVPKAWTMIRNHLMKALPPAMSEGRLIGVGGTITTLASVELELTEYNSKVISGVELSVHDVDRFIKRFQELNVEAIEGLPGMEPRRADIIEAGATIIKAFMSHSKIDIIKVSSRGFRYGLLMTKPDLTE